MDASAEERAKPTIVICRSGNRSGKAARLLEELGYEKVASMRGGMKEYRGGAAASRRAAAVVAEQRRSQVCSEGTPTPGACRPLRESGSSHLDAAQEVETAHAADQVAGASGVHFCEHD